MLNVRHLRNIPHQYDAFDRLELNPNHKVVIDALVSSHFERKRIENHGEIGTQDIISGKGGGLVLMLHGEPGVGKTATAEAVAKKYGKPLFSISCGDLGVVPAHVEVGLKEIFRLAHLWDCVLLLDEADIFLTARTAADLKRNGIVSVFLRIMDYYKGILFLTTNRVGKLDTAINSRIHITLHYKRFSEHHLREIFKMNIEKLKEVEEQRFEASQRIEPGGAARLHVVDTEILRFASDHFHRHSTSFDTAPWNGRQVRNAFVVAASLARREAATHGRPPQLRASHFLQVEGFTLDFDRFRANLLGGDDSHMARKREERDDSWGSETQAEKSLPRGVNKNRFSTMLEPATTGCGSPLRTPLSTTRSSERLGLPRRGPSPPSPSAAVPICTTPRTEKSFQTTSSRTAVDHGYNTPDSSFSDYKHIPESKGSPPHLLASPLQKKNEKSGTFMQPFELYSEFTVSGVS